MRALGRVFCAWAVLCLAAAAHDATEPTAEPSAAPSTELAAAQPCKCSGLLRRKADCSHRRRSTFGPDDLCVGLTTRVDLSFNSFTDFPATLGAHVVEVNVSHNQLTRLPRAPPLNAHTTSLDASHNLISQASDELRNLSRLQRLALDGNRLQSLACLPTPCALRRLSARDNLLRGSQALQGPLRACADLETLDVGGNPLAIVPRDVLADFRQLQRLRLANASLLLLDAEAFAGLEKLEYLDLSHNKLTSLPDRVFLQLEDLEELFLDDNSISNLSVNTFTGLRDLELLRITKNKLTDLSQDVFSPLTDLRSLVLNDNHLRTLSSGTFSGLEKVKSIALARNKLESLPGGLFAGLSSLKKVGLAKNRLSSLPPDLFSGVEALDLLDLSDNRLSSLPPDLLRGLSVKVLDLSLNTFTSMDGAALGGPGGEIERLDLTRNQLSAVPAFDASWPAVRAAFLDGNALSQASEAAVRGWLGRGDRRRALSLGWHLPLRTQALAQLHWALDDPTVALTVEGAFSGGCACGALRRGLAEVSFCAAVACPGADATWVDALRNLAPDAVES